jgi:hypothetical protein
MKAKNLREYPGDYGVALNMQAQHKQDDMCFSVATSLTTAEATEA